MRILYLFIVITLFFYSQTVLAVVPVANPSCNITTTLKVGSTGFEVECLQAVVGAAMDGKFGPLTKALVMDWQSRNGLAPDGIFGPLSRAVFYRVTTNQNMYPIGCTSTEGYSQATGIKCDISPVAETEQVSPVSSSPVYTIVSEALPPKVFSVSPEKVRSGDTVKIYGENFSPTGNTVRLRYGQIEARFDNLPSGDGKVISFVFQPPEVDTMNKEELLNLPLEVLNKILDPAKKMGGSVDDIVAPYRNMENEDDLRKFLSSNGHSFDELYDEFYVTIENIYGRGSSDKAILAGLRKLEFGSNLANMERKNFFQKLSSWFEVFVPEKVYAQLPQGGTNSGLITYCTCGPGYLTTMIDISANAGSGIYYWPPGFIPNVGNPIIAGPQLGFFIPDAGICSMYAGTSCYIVPNVHLPSLPWGQGL